MLILALATGARVSGRAVQAKQPLLHLHLGRAEGGDLSSLGLLLAAKRRQARVGHFLHHRQHGRELNVQHLVAVLDEAVDAAAAGGDLVHLADVRGHRQVQPRRDARADLPGIAVGCPLAADDQVEGGLRANARRQHVAGRPRVGPGEGLAGDEHGRVAAHSDGLFQCGDRLGRAHGHGHHFPAVLLAQADGDLDGEQVQRVDDGLDAFADHGAGGLVHLDGVGLRHLLDGHDDSHWVAPAPFPRRAASGHRMGRTAF
jgi:hypothetical protein